MADWSNTKEILKRRLGLSISEEFSVLNLDGVDLNGEIVESACFDRASFIKANLSESSFQDSSLYCANLTSANLSFSNFDGANLCDANLTNTDLRCSSFQHADLRCARFHDADLRLVNLHGSRLNLTGLAYTVIDSCQITTSPTHIHLSSHRWKRNEFHKNKLREITCYLRDIEDCCEDWINKYMETILFLLSLSDFQEKIIAEMRERTTRV